MMKPVFTSIAGLVAVCFVTGCSVFGINTADEAKYELLMVDDSFELRLYEPLVVAETFANGDLDEAGRLAFEKLFGYISGENTSSSKVDMTVPVVATKIGSTNGETMDRVVPIVKESKEGGWRYMFVLPRSYTITTAPVPLNKDIRLSSMPSKKIAVIRYSGSWDEKVINEKTIQLKEWITAKRLTSASKPRWAGYNPPWTLPFLRRNEVMIDVN